MKNLLLFSAIFGLMALIACNKQSLSEIDPTSVVSQTPALVANFTIENPNKKVNEKEIVLISNNSINAISYLWNFGNGVTSTLKNPEYAYPLCGIYTITLTVTGTDGVQKSAEQEITSLCIFGGVHGAD